MSGRFLVATLLASALATPASPQSEPKPARTPNLSLEPGTAAFDESSPELDVHLSKGGLPLVKPRVNGMEAGVFIFDTGAGICMVSTRHAARLGLVEEGPLQATGSGGSTQAKLFRAATLELGPLTLPDHPMMVSDLSFLGQHLGEEIAGIIGYGVLARCVAEIELGAPRIALRDPAEFADEELATAGWQPIEIEGRVPVVPATFEGHAGRFLLDTGATGGVSFYEPAVREWKLLEGRSVRDAKIGGVGGAVDGKEGELATFELGGVRREKVPAVFLTQARGATANDARAGQIGVDVLRSSRLVLDYAGARMALLKPTPRKP